MSDLKELCAVGDSSAFEGYVLAPPRLMELAEAEEEAAAQYLRRIAKAAAGLPAGARDAMHQRAVDNLRGNPFSYGTAGFDRWALSMSAAPFLAWLLLRIKQPRLTLGEAAEMLTGENFAARAGAVWSMWGYKPAKKATAPPVGPGPSTGGESSASSPSLHRADLE